MKVDLCSAGHPKKGFVGLDIVKYPAVEFVVDLNKGKLPFRDCSIEEFYEQNSFYELENPLQVIDECWRCLKKGGVLEFQEMYFSSHYAFTPLTKNFWNFASLRLFEDGYRYGQKWVVESVDFEVNHLPPRWLVNFNRNFYEKYLSRLMPLTYIKIRLRKR